MNIKYNLSFIEIIAQYKLSASELLERLLHPSKATLLGKWNRSTLPPRFFLGIRKIQFPIVRYSGAET